MSTHGRGEPDQRSRHAMRHASQHAIKASGSILCILIFFLARAPLWPLRLARALASALALESRSLTGLCGLQSSSARRRRGCEPRAFVPRFFRLRARPSFSRTRVHHRLEALERIDAEQPKAEAQHGGREAAEGEP